MPDYVIADASVFIIFDRLNQLRLLKDIYHKVYTTPEIAQEFNKSLPNWVFIESATDTKYKNFLCTRVDLGEASAIALAVERNDSLLILDDLKARKFAKDLNLQMTGTLGVMNKAKGLGLISNLKPLLNQLQSTDFRVSENIIKDLLQRNGES